MKGDDLSTADFLEAYHSEAEALKAAVKSAMDSALAGSKTLDQDAVLGLTDAVVNEWACDNKAKRDDWKPKA